MNRNDFQRFAEAFADGEFDDADVAEINAHLSQSEDSRQLATDLEGFKLLLQAQAEQDRAPEHLRTAVSAALARASAPIFKRATYAAATAAAVLLLLVFNLFRDAEPEGFRAELVTDPILDASVDWYRSNLPVEVTGPDADVIRDWFADKVDFPVRLPRFDEGMRSSVLGGRLSHLENARAAHLLYEVEGAKVSVLLFRADRELRVPRRHANAIRFQPFQGNRQGYNVALFEDNGVTYAITTALPRETFQRMLSNVRMADE